MSASGIQVSVLLPIRNEERHIRRCLESIAEQDQPQASMEVIVIDGMSTDGTVPAVESFRDRIPNLVILDNPGKTVPYAMNRGLRAARGARIVRVDGHCILAPDYVRRCLEALETTGADCVGGPMRCEGETYWGAAIAAAMSSRFGVGNVLFRREDYRGPADTVYLGAWPREVFGRIGGFDEELTNNQDDELAYRLRKAGGTVFLEPGIRSRYFARPSVPRLWKQYFRYGLYKVRVLQKHPLLMKGRHFVPGLFILGLLGAGIGAVFHPAAWPLLLGLAGAYAAGCALFSLLLARSAGWAYLPAFPVIFPALHLSYGSGFLVGIARFWDRWFRPEPDPPRLDFGEPGPALRNLPRVSVIVPMRNEARHLPGFLESLRRQDYPPDLVEYLIADGVSSDGSREMVEAAARGFPGGRIRLLRNQARATPEGLNLALREAQGEVVVRMDVHAVYADDYVRQCVRHLLESGAAQVGGPQTAEGDGWMGRAVAAAVNSPFGVGGATFRYLRRRAEVDSVYLGCARLETLRGLDGWDPGAVYDEDTDMNARMRRAGGRLILEPEIRVRYRPRATWPGLGAQYYRYGFGRARTFRRYPETMRLSHLVPPVFLLVLLAVAAPAAAGARPALLLLTGLLGGYFLAALAAGWAAAERRPLLGLLTALTFPWMHGAWAVGLFAGMVRFGVPLRAISQALRRLLGASAARRETVP